MVLIIFIGTKEHGFFLQELSIISEDITYTGYIDLDSINNYSTKEPSTSIIIDISLWSEKSELIVENICSIASSTRSKVIIYAVGYSPESILCSSLTAHGIKNIITAGNLADIKTEFLNFYNSTDSQIIERKPLYEAKNKIKSKLAMTVAVAGSQERIGTTTQCFQITKYLSAKGFNAAYLEFNNTKYLSKMKKLFNLSENNFNFEGINIYSANQINQILREYDYIIYDYGSITDSNFNMYSFLEKSTCIIVCGDKPNEIDYSTAALNQFQNNKNILYLFNFVSAADMEDIKALMGNHKTYFSPLIPDMFSVLLQQQKLYDSIIFPRVSSLQPKKKHSALFGFRRNK